MHAELVLDARGVDVVAIAKRAVGIDHELGNQEQRNSARTGGRIRQAREHEMHDVVGHVVIAIGDEDLGALDAIGAVGLLVGAGAQRADIGAGLRLGQLHGAGPFAGDELLEIGLLQVVGAVRIERLDRRQREQRAEAEGNVRRAPDFGAGGVDRKRQALAAEGFRPRHRVPAAVGPALVGIGPARRGRDLAAVELDAVLVAHLVERGEHVGGELAGFFQHRRRDVGVEIAVMAGFDRGFQPGAMVERKQHVVDRRAVGHGVTPGSLLPPSSHETGALSTAGRAIPSACGAMGPRGLGARSVKVTQRAPYIKARIGGERSPGESLLKWPPALYRRAGPEGICGNLIRCSISALGRSQAVRQRILIPPFGGSIPPAPATQ